MTASTYMYNAQGEHNAKEISDALPFIEYEVHRQLINKLKIKGMNALFGMQLKISVGDRTLIGTATATACFLTALPPPTRPRLLCSPAWQSGDPNYLQRTQQKLEERIAENLEHYGIARTRSRKVRRERPCQASGCLRIKPLIILLPLPS